MSMIAKCGLDCHECDAFIATQENNDEKRKATAKMWSQMYGGEVPWESINCKGCQSDGSCLFSHCKVCEIRKCANEKNMSTCADCGEYGKCETLEGLLKDAPEAKVNLEALRG